ncbi:aldose epimerase family protein [Maribacter sp. 2308TA10-17]|uniref:aldose epimerase family protein n=1 Tax=Maribacter sp. 2308TA10-17 TaxID=3386276 RepID=UPI0039BC70CA
MNFHQNHVKRNRIPKFRELGYFLFMVCTLSFAKTDKIESFELKNEDLKVRLTNYGATIQELWVKDKNGKPINIVLGFNNPRDYLESEMYLGSCVGRYAGRLSSTLILEGSEYLLTERSKGIHIHGGKEGFNRKIWEVLNIDKASITFSYLSKDGEEGYPGNLYVKAKYTLKGNGLQIQYSATTDAITIVNLTNHSHFNLSPGKSLENQYVQVLADSILEVSDHGLPTGSFLSLDKTKKDFRKSKAIGKIKFDETFVLQTGTPQITYYSPYSGIVMDIQTNQPAVVIYTPSKVKTICFETQNFPNAPNFEHFPSALLKSGEEYRNNTYLEFWAKENNTKKININEKSNHIR